MNSLLFTKYYSLKATVLYICIFLLQSSTSAMVANSAHVFYRSTLSMISNGEIVKCYPNPAVSYINFSLDNEYANIQYRLIIYNFTGKKMHDKNLSGPISKIDLSNFYRGMYIYQLLDLNGNVITNGKFQVIK